MSDSTEAATVREQSEANVEKSRMRLTWKDVAELTGLAAIIVSLVFVVIEMRQARNIAISDGDKAHAGIVIATQNSINSHADVWLRGNSGAELNEVESVIYANLMAAKMESLFVAWLSLMRLGEDENAETLLNDFTGFLFRNPGARRVWLEKEETLDQYRRLLNPDGNRFTGYTSKIKNDLEKLDRLPAEQLSER